MHEEKIFCENLKNIRKSYGYSKVKMARLLGIGVKSLSLIESGIIPPRLGCEVLIRITNTFGVSPSGIFTRIKL